MIMSNSSFNIGAAAALAATTITNLSAAEKQTVDELIARIKNPDDNVRGAAWQNAGPTGAPAVKPLAGLMADRDMEVSRSAKRALWVIVRHAGRPGADKERQAVLTELVPLLNGTPTPVRRETLWMLSEIATDSAIKPIAACLKDPEVREDARAALERIPGKASVAALKDGLQSVPEDFKPAVAQSLRVRGVEVKGYPSQKLVPTRPKPVPPPQTL
jgi:HEAT repeat protein